jgi:hypothetical protein
MEKLSKKQFEVIAVEMSKMMTDKQINDVRESMVAKGQVAGQGGGGQSKNPYNRLMDAIKSSAKSGSHGGSTTKPEDAHLTPEQLQKKIEKGSKYRDPEVTRDTLKHKLEVEQDMLCYWTGVKIDPERIFTRPIKNYDKNSPNYGKVTYEPYYGETAAMMSADRLNMEGEREDKGYTLKNIVITMSGVNKMRGTMEHDKFVLFLHKCGFPINSKLKHIIKKNNKES